MFSWFEKLVHPYPESQPMPPPRGFMRFIWFCTKGVRPYIAAMTLMTAIIGVFEALLFAALGRIVDWLSKIEPAQLWAQEGHTLVWLVVILAASPLLIALQTMYKHQTLAGNFPMLLRWNFHRLMLSQSMSFYQNEFAGRVATKVMQSALAVRDFCMIVGDILVFIAIYFATLIGVVGSFDMWMLAPFFVWLAAFAVRCATSCRACRQWPGTRPMRAR